MRNTPLNALVLASVLALAACHAQPAGNGSAASGDLPAAAPLTHALLHGQLVLPAVPGHPAAAYFTLDNGGAQPVTVTGVSVTGAASAEIHETTGDTMEQLNEVVIPAHGKAVFAPGGKHVMVFGLKPGIAPGARLTLTLLLAHGAKLTAPLDAVAPGSDAQMAPASGAMTGMRM